MNNLTKHSTTFQKYLLGALKVLGVFVVLFFSYQMYNIVAPYVFVQNSWWRTDIDFLMSKQKIVRLMHYMGAFYVHIFSSLLVLLAGATQFSQVLMTKYAVIHRNIGKMYVFLVLVVSAPGALIMSYYANGGTIAKVGFIILSILWWIFTWLAYSKIRERNFVSHANFMLRSYALTFSAITLRIYQFLIHQFFATNFPLDSLQTYQMLSYMSWIPNLIVVEILIYKGFNQWILKKNS